MLGHKEFNLGTLQVSHRYFTLNFIALLIKDLANV